MSAPFVDGRGRAVNYLRLSVTDRCNLRCSYCVGGPRHFIPHGDILRYEELMGLIGLSLSLGMKKVRLTGGEPFVRKEFPEFLQRVLALFPGLDLRITTNATLLAPHVPSLARAGLSRVNISLDTLDPARFRHITGHDLYHEVRRAIDACLNVSIKVKLNVVAMAGINDHELPAFLDLARKLPVDLRFIERMPVGEGCGQGKAWSASDILGEARELAVLRPVERNDPDRGPARMYDIEGGAGRLGVISPLSCHFCDQCNRLRVTSDGRLRTCLFSDTSYRLRPIIRHPKLGMTHLEKVLRAALLRKPLGNELLKHRPIEGAVCATRMHTIGG